MDDYVDGAGDRRRTKTLISRSGSSFLFCELAVQISNCRSGPVLTMRGAPGQVLAYVADLRSLNSRLHATVFFCPAVDRACVYHERFSFLG